MAENNSSAHLKTAEGDAPPSNLPSWEECQLRVSNSEFIAKRIAEGGYGAEHDSKLATELHRFIHEYDDADSYRSAWFRHRLEKLLHEVTAQAVAAQAAPAAVAVALAQLEGACEKRAALTTTEVYNSLAELPGMSIALLELDVARGQARAALAATPTLPATEDSSAGDLAEVHPDDAAVDALAAKMKAKLAKQRAKGYGGWDTPECSQPRLSAMLRDHVAKGDPVDVANFCAFLAARGEGIEAGVQTEPVTDEQIKAVFLANGFTIKEGLTDLKSYVYKAARALLQLSTTDQLAALIEGMSVSVDVSTGDHDAGHRYFGTVTEVMEDAGDKHGVTLLVQDAKPNFEAGPTESVLINGIAYTLPEPAAHELLRLHIELLQGKKAQGELLAFDATFTNRVIEALQENEDPVSVDAAEEMAKLRDLLLAAPQAQPADALLLHALELAYDHIEMDSLRLSHCKDAAVIDAAMAAAQEGGNAAKEA
ncbi:hypothetical protein [Comamonas sediminis]|uniref:Uncharacterized protein n=1 Tax=Comamonas sediminis TaxID=1783360 RepID=A0ABV4B767_9BURK